MGSVIVFRQSDRISVLTDGGAYLHDGKMAGMNARIFPLPHLNAALTVRGSQYALAFIGGALTFGAERFDDLRDQLPDILSLLSPNPNGGGEAVEVVIAGWSEASGVDAEWKGTGPPPSEQTFRADRIRRHTDYNSVGSILRGSQPLPPELQAQITAKVEADLRTGDAVRAARREKPIGDPDEK